MSFRSVALFFRASAPYVRGAGSVSSARTFVKMGSKDNDTRAPSSHTFFTSGLSI